MVSRSNSPVILVGSGVASLAAAIDLAASQVPVLVLEKDDRVGGKAQGLEVSGVWFDGGPTVLTMPWVFEDLFARAGRAFSSYVTLERADVLARHTWFGGECLDLFSDVERSRDAIARFSSSAEAERFEQVMRRFADTHAAVEGPFMRSPRPTVMSLVRAAAQMGWRGVLAIDALRTLERALSSELTDPRLVQLFGRYATYVGGSPFEVPATLGLIAHVEANGVHRLASPLGDERGMRALVRGLATLARELGVEFRTNATVKAIELQGGRAVGVELLSGERVRGSAVIWNGDVSALASALPTPRRAPAPTAPAERSLSAIVWCMHGCASGSPLVHHNVFFSDDYRAEFDAIFAMGRVPETPTVYVCAQDRGDVAPTNASDERLFFLINAPATGDRPNHWSDTEKRRCDELLERTMARFGVTLTPSARVRRTPDDWARAFPGSGGAIYGARPRGPTSSLSRPGATTALPGLFLAGGSVHPGPGVPMACLSGRIAATMARADLDSIAASRTVATSGTTSTESATTVVSPSSSSP